MSTPRARVLAAQKEAAQKEAAAAVEPPAQEAAEEEEEPEVEVEPAAAETEEEPAAPEKPSIAVRVATFQAKTELKAKEMHTKCMLGYLFGLAVELRDDDEAPTDEDIRAAYVKYTVGIFSHELSHEDNTEEEEEESMYNTEAPPKRRVYANGYYSDWFDIKSGVAQGCPLSPLLFLVVAEGYEYP